MNLWDEILARVETKVNRHSFYTWFKPTTFRGRGRSGHHREGAERPFQGLADEALLGVIGEAHERSRSRADLVSNFVAERARARPRRFRSSPGRDRRASTRGRPPSGAASGPAGLNPRYTFDTFIVGSSNQFAHAACRAVAEAPSRSYNPLFIYGGVGLGKTHLMHAVGQYVLRTIANLKLTYISSERFMNEMINAVRYDRVLDFRERYRRSTSCWSTTSSSWQARKARRPSSSTPSTRCTTHRSRSSSAATARRTRFRRSKSGCDRGSSGGSSPTSSRPISRRRSPF